MTGAGQESLSPWGEHWWEQPRQTTPAEVRGQGAAVRVPVGRLREQVERGV